MVATKHCCWGTCMNDSRYSHKLLKSLKELLDSGEKVFLSFPKLSYWGWKGRKITKQAKVRLKMSKWSLRKKLYTCLLRLKTCFTVKTLSFLLSSTQRQIRGSYIRVIFTTNFGIFSMQISVLREFFEHILHITFCAFF